MKQRSKQQKIESPSLFIREVIFIMLVAVVGGLAVYTSRDDHSAFGLFNRPAYAQEMPAIISFRSDVLTGEAFLELELYPQAVSAEQVEATLADPKTPPPVSDLTVLNTRVGDEVALFWTRPEFVQMVNIYRATIDGSTVKDRKLIAEGFSGLEYIDDTVQNRVRYEYSVVSVNEVGGKTYASADSPSVLITPTDEIPPSPPRNVGITPVLESQKTGLLLTWELSGEEDVDLVRLYRSTSYGNRGEELAAIKKKAPQEYFDAVDPNKTYYYTVVSVDASGNSSSDDFQMPTAGNSLPFTPFDQEDETVTATE
ncbi:MAG: hypothetical protein ABIG66_02270 [Candidatus Kerfeldbacteria bacterium]